MPQGEVLPSSPPEGGRKAKNATDVAVGVNVDVFVGVSVAVGVVVDVKVSVGAGVKVAVGGGDVLVLLRSFSGQGMGAPAASRQSCA